MAQYEYKVVPAPSKGTKAKGVKSPEDRFALTLQELMNEHGAEGWEYQRADTLPSLERSGLTGSTTNWRHVLVFRRVKDAVEVSDRKREISAPQLAAVREFNDPDHPSGQPGATQMQHDDGVEELSEVSGETTTLRTLVASRNKSGKSDT